MRVDARVGYSGRAGLTRWNDDRRGWRWWYGVRVDDTRVPMPAHQEYVWFYIFLKVS